MKGSEILKLTSLTILLLAWSALATELDQEFFGDLKARNLGSATMSGRITDIESPRGQPNVFYVGTASGGLWKSTDGAVTFEPIFDEHHQSIGCLRIDPSDPDTIWVGTGEINVRNSVSYGDGLYKSTDGGETWKHLGFEHSERIAEIIVHPDDSKVVYVAVQGQLWSEHDERGLYKTSDGGETWERILYVDEKTGCIDLDMDPQEPNTLYAAMWQVRRWPYFFYSGGPGSGLHKSTDGGKTWTKLTNGLPEGELGRIDLDIAPSRPSRVYAIVEGEGESTGLYRSDDLGASWARISGGFNLTARPFYLTTVVVDPVDYNRIYNPSLFLGISDDGGKSWPGGFNGFFQSVHSDHQSLWINPENPYHLLLGTDGGIYVSYNAGNTFRHVGSLPVSQFYRVTADNQIPYHVYGGLQDNGSWSAPVSAPGGVANDHWKSLGVGDGFCTAADPEDPNIVYWESQGGILNRLHMDSQENKMIQPYPEKGMERNRFNWNSPLVISPSDAKTIYFGSQYLYRSRDRGDNWERISPDLTTDDPEKQNQEESGGLTKDATTAENHCSIFTIAESPLDPDLIWVGTDDGNLQVTRDGGKNWENVVDKVGVPEATWVSSVFPSPHDKGTVFATFTGHRSGDKNVYVYSSTDYGQTWTSLATDIIEGHCHMILQDVVNPGLLFLGTERGLFISLDQGQQWIHFLNGIPKVSVRDMVVQQRERDLVIGTHGRGIYILDDITALRALKPEVLTEKAVMLPSRPGRTVKPRMYQVFPGDAVFTAANPPSGIQITYYLKRRHLFGDLKIAIFDESGEQIKTILGGKRKGLNRVNWNMRLDAPKAARGAGLSMGALFGPYVKTGRYTVKLLKGKETYEIETELLPPHNNPHSEADMALQNEATMKLYRMQTDASFTADQFTDLMDQIKARSEALGKGSLFKKLEERSKALEELKGELVAPNAGIFVTRERLRDDVVNLYAAVGGYSGRPSDSQLSRMADLEKTVAEFLDRAKPLLDIADLNRGLQRAKQEPLQLLDRQSWLDKDSTAGSVLAINKAALKLWQRQWAPVQHLMLTR